MNRKTFLSASLASLALVLPVFPAAAEGACLSQQQAQSAKNSGQVRPLDEITPVGLPPGAKIVGQSEVCDLGGQLYYKVPVILPGGDAKTVFLNARTGQPKN